MGVIMEGEYTGVQIKKLYEGLAEIRDYQLEKIERKKRGIMFILEDEKKFVPYDKLTTGKKGKFIRAKFPLPNNAIGYQLIGYVWDDLSDQPVPVQQMELL